MRIEISVPPLPESVSDAKLLDWHKNVGETVGKGENLVDLETDKVVLEVPAPEDGVVVEVRGGKGDVVVSGQPIAVIDTSVRPAAPAASAATEKPAPVLSPAVRRLVAEHALDPAAIPASGREGRLTKQDVLDFLETRPAAEKARLPAGGRSERRVPMSRLRARIAERMLEAQHRTATLTTFNEVNLQKVFDIRNAHKARFEQQHGIKLGFMSFFVKASVEALRRFPIVNASLEGEEIVYHDYYDIGIAVSTDRGLVVPILRDADRTDFAGIEKAIAEFGQKARSGKLSLDELSGGTFTITNGGIFGSMLSTPILNPPQSAILGMHAIKERPVVEDGQIVIRPMIYLALSYDHRLIDGRDAVSFLFTIKELLEDPVRLMLAV
ncbi:2-oxoglutarate dehydrogenase complex dihydrolipoyllysine-residue succinyltransferase [Methylococcus capsulatus]|jgi:2-oxoglutarate dehydrogenase E2 component (dihydrolipoamide succinyltransferase)|uniref:Dihydrolipoyllysine-residue succinyltransferase component of 2-oxoglutarate dehydrogenase complex n=1 Tax=Methylococcus capsulatus TaxID=414 RepID=A0AA35US05_METCP|nr:2-oxoglutarate dehydrogenase complex dihydrolipoyllysine-residue succinyltransferase [Methylococcus capsulatus]QXP91226.1 2-oxoglutarate dehydrogenase complex dihydrolipoyllysine-residue succinyltransferase [Methylococcus capsulatus]CAI8859899.1 dihydrolipoyltranssuccinylase [Methylococcus capsulatus]